MKFAWILIFSTLSFAQSSPSCKFPFSVVWKDARNNFSQGLPASDLKWFEKKISKKYPELCYQNGPAPVMFFFSDTPATYHGTRTVSSTNSAPITGTVKDSETGEKIGTIEGDARVTTEQIVPYSVDYNVVYLSIKQRQADQSWAIRTTLSGKTLHPTMYGFCTRNCHPYRALLEDAIKWVHNGGLTAAP